MASSTRPARHELLGLGDARADVLAPKVLLPEAPREERRVVSAESAGEEL